MLVSQLGNCCVQVRLAGLYLFCLGPARFGERIELFWGDAVLLVVLWIGTADWARPFLVVTKQITGLNG